MKRNKGVSMITLIITIIVIIILAAIAFVGMDDATGSAQYAKFSSEFGDYATNFTAGAVTKVQESLGLAGKVANKSQIVYCAARGVNLSEFDQVLNGVVTPGGYTSEKFQNDIKDATGATYVLASATTPCYEIKDDVMNEYKGKSFYGNANGQETHWVTATGKVFTLPGYPRTVDGEERMYISADLYYVPKDGDMILASELTSINPVKVGDEASGATVGNQQVADAADHATPSGEGGGEEGGDPAVLAAIKVGDYVEYTPNEAEVTANWGGLPTSIQYNKGTLPTKWRVCAIEGNNVVIMPTEPVGSLKLGESGNLQKCYDDYKNAEEIINKVCKIYTNKALGVTESSIRSLTIEDLEKVGENLASDKANYLANTSYEYKAGDYVAAYYNGSKNVINPETDVTKIKATTGESRTVKNTYYYSSNPGWKILIKDIDETQVSKKDGKTEVRVKYRASEGSSIEPNSFGELLGYYWSWLASSCVFCGSSYAGFDVYVAGGGNVDACDLLDSDGYTYSRSNGVRPLVTLSSKVLEGEGDSSNFATWTIKD